MTVGSINSAIGNFPIANANNAMQAMDIFNRFGGVDVAKLAEAALGDGAGNLPSIFAQLSPVEQGQLLRAMDGIAKSGRPEAESFTRKADTAQKSDRPDAESFVRTKDPITRKALDPATASTATSVPHVPLGIAATFGADAARLAARSPSLMGDLQALQTEGWTVVSARGGGTTCNRDTKVITIDVDDNNSTGLVVQALAHEVGHARHVLVSDESSRAAYLRTTLADEGAATLANIRAQREIIAAGGEDIGIAGNSANHAAYNAAYDAFLVDGDAVKARDAIGAIFGSGERTSNTGQTYADYYGSAYDAAHPPTP